jgi:hypothetical protein
MRRAGILPKYENVSAEHLRAVVRWINGCVVVGMILAAVSVPWLWPAAIRSDQTQPLVPNLQST